MNRRRAAADLKIERDMSKRAPMGLVETHQRKAGARPARVFIPQAWQKKTGRAASLVESFYHAFHGIYLGIKEERNLRIHLCAAFTATGMGLWLKLDTTSWLALALSMGLVIVAEFLNTALEHLVDLSARGQYHRSARYAKDTAAAAVLIAAFIAAIVGLFVFIPRLAAMVHI
jgi:diacylglycerol kinase